MSAVLTVENVTKTFGHMKAVDGVGFHVDSGEVVALIGPNGAGKSTCFNLVTGQLRPDSGRVLIDGKDVTGQAPHRICRFGVGRTFQIAATFASMSVVENVQMALQSHHHRLLDLHKRAHALYRDEALALLEKVSMADQAGRPAGILAYGDLKRLELAIALAQPVRLLLMDEPTAGMAAAERTALMTAATDIARRDGVALLFTEHDMEVVFGYADRLIVMDRGRIIAEGPPQAVRENARVQEIYLGTSSTPLESAHADRP